MSLFKGKALYNNMVSYIGLAFVFISSALILATLLWGFAIKKPSPYLGIFTFMIFPSILLFGFLLFLYGMRRESLRRRRLGTEEAPPYPYVDLNLPHHRRRFMIILVGGTLLVILLSFVGYNAFIFTESVAFCGTLCHTVMEPEYQSYLHSPHARVSCVECHVGHGVSWYVKSKLSGVYQVYAVLTNSYERPIPVPIKNLRPARETCEECHWPEKFFGAQLQQNPHFRYDETNSAEQVSLVLKTGGGSVLGQNEGIHWHTVINNRVTYAAEDDLLQEIVWMSVRDSEGNVRVYQDTETSLSQDQIDALPKHELDCMDCHNRPTHIYRPPELAVDLALAGGQIKKDLPWIKKVTVDALVQDYPTKADAEAGILETIQSYYSRHYPPILQSRGEDIREAARIAYVIYSQSIFPEMKVNWKTYHSNIGHRNWDGCFRCHDGKHVREDGVALSMECDVCHTVPQRGPYLPLGSTLEQYDQPWHPMPLEGAHETLLCSRCHAAGFRPPTDCAECHRLNPEDEMISMGCDSCHKEPGKITPLTACDSCHGDIKGLHNKGAHPDTDCTECHQPHEWNVSGNTCLTCHEDAGEHSEGTACVDCHQFSD